MSARMTRRQAAKNLAYCNSELLKSDLTEERRANLEGHADFARRALVGHCTRCGRSIEDPESIRLGLGSTCQKHLDQADAADRATDRAQAHELSFG